MIKSIKQGLELAIVFQIQGFIAYIVNIVYFMNNFRVIVLFVAIAKQKIDLCNP